MQTNTLSHRYIKMSQSTIATYKTKAIGSVYNNCIITLLQNQSNISFLTIFGYTKTKANYIKESIMQIALNLGTININDQEVAKFIQNKSIDEIKSMIVDFLKSQINTDIPQKSKGKWGAFADRMSGLTTPEITEHIQKTS